MHELAIDVLRQKIEQLRGFKMRGRSKEWMEQTIRDLEKAVAGLERENCGVACEKHRAAAITWKQAAHWFRTGRELAIFAGRIPSERQRVFWEYLARRSRPSSSARSISSASRSDCQLFLSLDGSVASPPE